MADRDAQKPDPLDHTSPPEAGSNVAPPVVPPSVSAGSDEGTARLTRAINEREDTLDDAADAAAAETLAPKPRAAAKAEPKLSACNQCGAENKADARFCKGCGIGLRV